ncbi:adenylate/guanylate cyclase domain-containing protein [Sneathiella marina]|uniref:Adenylate/guanylate cyclase domain-containing protein n=1 Tax=Sneathiella marina TaxID=2950108 RepID=A0ABY4W0Q2_9PROT|nr:adenylate/guanylate cyclase domain-containing protein [Sneathiella marina]USG60434.1 adenylate/guanylate cyclase domain-containing protein [Sneathiella marina]
MADTDTAGRFGMRRRSLEETEGRAHKYLEEALDQNKREGLLLSVRARTISLVVIGVFVAFLNPHYSVIYYEVLLVGFALIGWAQLKIGRVGRSRAELLLLFLDLALMTVVLAVPNPLDPRDWSVGMQYKFNNFTYFYVLLAGATLAYSWRTLFAVAGYTTLLWMGAYFWAKEQPSSIADLTDKVTAAVSDYPHILEFIDPNNVQLEPRIQEVLLFAIVAGILALNSWRANRLLVRQAEAARGRANLARHFPPNIVDNLATRDQPLGDVREQPVAVLFADIVGFTKMAEAQTPDAIVALLREFHSRMEACVFDNGGTLDKFLGDGLMATFGTPDTSPDDAMHALQCAQSMNNVMKEWNATRQDSNLPPIRLSIGIHFGHVVLGDIGSERRLEYAVLGDVVNVASRLEALTRPLNASVLVSDAVIEAAGGPDTAEKLGYKATGPQEIRGREQTISGWQLSHDTE